MTAPDTADEYCPTCRVAPGQPCNKKANLIMGGPFHLTRVDRATRHYDRYRDRGPTPVRVPRWAGTPTFRAWLAEHRKAETAIGDLARDVAEDREYRGSLTYDTLRQRIRDAGGYPPALQTLDQAWAQYQAQAGAATNR